MSEWSPCPACGTENDASASSCRICGYRLDAGGGDSHKCARCGAGLGTGFEFCQTCGLRVHSRRPRPVTSSLRLVSRGREAGGEQHVVGEIGDIGAAMGVTPAAEPASAASPGIPARMAEAPPASSGIPARMAEAPPAAAPSQPPQGGAQFVAAGAAQPGSSQAQFVAAGSTQQGTSQAQFVAAGAAQQGASQAQPGGPQAQFVAAGATQQGTSPAQARAGQIAFSPEPAATSTNPAPAPASGWSPPISSSTSLPVVPSRRPGANLLRLVLVQRDGSEGEVVPLGDAPLTIGRLQADLRFPGDEFLESTHARVDPVAGGVRVVDLGTHNGVYLRISRPEPVFPGDLFLLGHHLLRLENVPPAGREQGPSAHGVKWFGTPLLPAWGRLVLIGAGGAEAESHYLRHLQVVFGRELGDIVFPADPFVSWQHAQLSAEVGPDGMGVTLTDLRSANGTYLRTRGDVILQPGDMFRVGDQIFRVRMH